MTRAGYAVFTALAVAAAAHAQEPNGSRRLSLEGVGRASALVDSVFVDRTLEGARIAGGDWASYLLARLGAEPIPDSLAIEVVVDTSRIQVRGRLQDLPEEARALLGPLAGVVDTSTVIEADVRLDRTGPEIVRFRLHALLVNGFAFPEFLLAPMMSRVGRQYPALTASGRDLYVQVPRDGAVALGRDAVVLRLETASGSPATPPASRARP